MEVSKSKLDRGEEHPVGPVDVQTEGLAPKLKQSMHYKPHHK